MNETSQLPEAVRRRLVWPLRLTRAGMAAERLTRAFWPVWTLIFTVLAALAFGFQDWAPVELFWAACLATPLGLIWAVGHGLRRFRWPTADDAMARLDATLPGRPLATLADRQALGGADEGSKAVWRAHLARMAERARAARTVLPDLRLAARDPHALRYAALTAFVMAILFGSLWKIAEVGRMTAAPQAANATAAATWEGWVEPPAYTGRPSLYLNSIAAGPVELPQGSRLVVRFYGPAEALTLRETVSDPVPAAPPPAQPAAQAEQRSHEVAITRSGIIAIDGEGGREWAVTLLPDRPPEVSLSGPMERLADGAMSQPFKAGDDYAVVRGEARFELDMTALDRRYGLAAAPEPQAPLIFDLPMPVTGSRADFAEVLAENASEHPWANLPVKMSLTVTDGAGQTGTTGPQAVSLPGRRFFDPLASALIEMRRDLIWSAQANAPRVLQVLRAVTYKPEGFIQNQRAYLMLRVAIRRLDDGLTAGPLKPALREEIAQALWDIAVLLEDGGLDGALERMRQAQERLSEAIRNGASKDEIQKLMDELRNATDDYLKMLAEKGEQDPADRFTKNQPTQELTQDQLQQMMDQIQKLMEEGRMAEAQELLEQLNRLMENLKVTQGQQGDGQRPGDQAMRGLRDTLRGQQDLSDDAFRQQQDQFGQAPGSPRDRRPGQDRGPSQDQPGEGNPTQRADRGSDGDGEGLADRQRQLRDELRRQQGMLPDAQGQDADAARRALDNAGRAMEEAEKALRDNDTPGAIDRQAEAIENLREGLRHMNEALARNQTDQFGEDGQAQGDTNRELPRDPLGRTDGSAGQSGTDREMLQGEDIYRHARNLLDEIRRRSADQTRPPEERDYLRRLLDRF